MSNIFLTRKVPNVSEHQKGAERVVCKMTAYRDKIGIGSERDMIGIAILVIRKSS